MAHGTGIVEDLGLDEVHLAQVGLVRIATYARPMLDEGPGVGIAEGLESGHERDGLGRHLAEPVGPVPADGNDTGHGHTVILAGVGCTGQMSTTCRRPDSPRRA